jgi:hypothetical protein
MVSDTHARARAFLTARFRQRGDGERLAMAMAMSEEMRDVARSGARVRLPGATADDVELAVAELYLGRELLEKVLARRR